MLFVLLCCCLCVVVVVFHLFLIVGASRCSQMVVGCGVLLVVVCNWSVLLALRVVV